MSDANAADGVVSSTTSDATLPSEVFAEAYDVSFEPAPQQASASPAPASGDLEITPVQTIFAPPTAFHLRLAQSETPWQPHLIQKDDELLVIRPNGSIRLVTLRESVWPSLLPVLAKVYLQGDGASRYLQNNRTSSERTNSDSTNSERPSGAYLAVRRGETGQVMTIVPADGSSRRAQPQQFSKDNDLPATITPSRPPTPNPIVSPGRTLQQNERTSSIIGVTQISATPVPDAPPNRKLQNDNGNRNQITGEPPSPGLPYTNSPPDRRLQGADNPTPQIQQGRCIPITDNPENRKHNTQITDSTPQGPSIRQLHLEGQQRPIATDNQPPDRTITPGDKLTNKDLSVISNRNLALAYTNVHQSEMMNQYKPPSRSAVEQQNSQLLAYTQQRQKDAVAEGTLEQQQTSQLPYMQQQRGDIVAQHMFVHQQNRQEARPQLAYLQQTLSPTVPQQQLVRPDRFGSGIESQAGQLHKPIANEARIIAAANNVGENITNNVRLYAPSFTDPKAATDRTSAWSVLSHSGSVVNALAPRSGEKTGDLPMRITPKQAEQLSPAAKEPADRRIASLVSRPASPELNMHATMRSERSWTSVERMLAQIPIKVARSFSSDAAAKSLIVHGERVLEIGSRSGRPHPRTPPVLQFDGNLDLANLRLVKPLQIAPDQVNAKVYGPTSRAVQPAEIPNAGKAAPRTSMQPAAVARILAAGESRSFSVTQHHLVFHTGIDKVKVLRLLTGAVQLVSDATVSGARAQTRDLPGLKRLNDDNATRSSQLDLATAKRIARERVLYDRVNPARGTNCDSGTNAKPPVRIDKQSGCPRELLNTIADRTSDKAGRSASVDTWSARLGIDVGCISRIAEPRYRVESFIHKGRLTCSEKRYLTGLELILAGLATISAVAQHRGERRAASRLVDPSKDADNCLPGLTLDDYGDETDETLVELSIRHNMSHEERTAILMRPKYLVQPGDSLVSIAEDVLHDPQLGWLILQVNRGSIPTNWNGNICMAELTARQEIELPVAQDIMEFYRARPSLKFKNKRLITSTKQSAFDSELLVSNFRNVISSASSAAHPRQETQPI